MPKTNTPDADPDIVAGVALARAFMERRGFDYLDAAYAVVANDSDKGGAGSPLAGVLASAKWPAFVAAVKAEAV